MMGLILRARRALALRLCPPLGAELVALAAEVQAHKGAVRIAERAAQGKEALVQRLRAAEERVQLLERAVRDEISRGTEFRYVEGSEMAARLRKALGAPADPDPRSAGPGGGDIDEEAGFIRHAVYSLMRRARTAEEGLMRKPSPEEAEYVADNVARLWREHRAAAPVAKVATGVPEFKAGALLYRQPDGTVSPAPPPPPAAPPALPAASWHVGFDTACPSRTVLTHVPDGIELRADGKPLQVGDEIRADMKLSAAPQVLRYGLPQCTCATGVCAMHDGVFNAPAAPNMRRHRWPEGKLVAACEDCGAMAGSLLCSGPCPGPKGGDGG